MNNNISTLIKSFSNFQMIMGNYVKMNENGGSNSITSNASSTSTSTRASTAATQGSASVDHSHSDTPPPCLLEPVNHVPNGNTKNENNIVNDEVVHTENIDDINGTHFGDNHFDGGGKNENDNENENENDNVNENDNGYESKTSDLNTERLRSLDSEDSMSFEETDVNTSYNSQSQQNSNNSNNSNNRNSRKALSKTPNDKFSKYFESHSMRSKAKSHSSLHTTPNGTPNGVGSHKQVRLNKRINNRSTAAASTRARLRSLAKSTDFGSHYDFTPSYADSSHITYDSNGNMKNSSYSHGSSHGSKYKTKRHRARMTSQNNHKNSNNTTNNTTTTNNNNNNTNSNNNNTNKTSNNNVSNGKNEMIESNVNEIKESNLQKSKSQTDISYNRNGKNSNNKNNRHNRHKTDHIYLNTENRVTINVGGTLFETTINTLAADQGSMLSAMFSGRFNLEKDENGAIFIDRDPTHFRHILNFLRDGVDYLKKGGLLQQPEGIVNELLQEARYYNIRPLVDYIQVWFFFCCCYYSDNKLKRISQNDVPSFFFLVAITSVLCDMCFICLLSV